MTKQLSLDGPFPATPTERERAVLAAFGQRSPRMVVSMRAARYPCRWPSCMAPPGEQCSSPIGGTFRRKRLAFPHGSRVAVTVVCDEHGSAPGTACPGDGDCLTRATQVAPLMALDPRLETAHRGRT